MKLRALQEAHGKLLAQLRRERRIDPRFVMACRWWVHCLYGSGLVGAAVITGARSRGAGVGHCDEDSPSYLDPEAWERAAKAVRDINSQQNAKKVWLAGSVRAVLGDVLSLQLWWEHYLLRRRSCFGWRFGETFETLAPCEGMDGLGGFPDVLPRAQCSNGWSSAQERFDPVLKGPSLLLISSLERSEHLRGWLVGLSGMLNRCQCGARSG